MKTHPAHMDNHYLNSDFDNLPHPPHTHRHLLWSCMSSHVFVYRDGHSIWSPNCRSRINLLYELIMKLSQLLSVGQVEGDQEKTSNIFPFLWPINTMFDLCCVQKQKQNIYIPERKVESSISSLVKCLVKCHVCLFSITKTLVSTVVVWGRLSACIRSTSLILDKHT